MLQYIKFIYEDIYIINFMHEYYSDQKLYCRYAQLVNVRFTKIVGFQFMASTMVICCNLYQLTDSALSANHIPLIMYTCCMLTQIFIYCWFGNKVKFKVYQIK